MSMITREPPTEPGVYWWRSTRVPNKWMILRVVNDPWDPGEDYVLTGTMACGPNAREAPDQEWCRIPDPDEVCEWEYDEFHDKWDTKCGRGWYFETGGIEENAVRFCHHCGLPVKEKEGQG